MFNKLYESVKPNITTVGLHISTGKFKRVSPIYKVIHPSLTTKRRVNILKTLWFHYNLDYRELDYNNSQTPVLNTIQKHRKCWIILSNLRYISLITHALYKLPTIYLQIDSIRIDDLKDPNIFRFKNKFAYNQTLVNLINNITGKKFYMYVSQNAINKLPINLLNVSNTWASRFKYFNWMFKKKLFIREALHMLFLTLYFKDLHFYIRWFKQTLLKIDFWKYKKFFTFSINLFRYMFRYNFLNMNVMGVKIKFKGKVNVAGNSRKRIYSKYTGHLNKSAISTKVLYKYTQIPTFTGAIGTHLWVFFK